MKPRKPTPQEIAVERLAGRKRKVNPRSRPRKGTWDPRLTKAQRMRNYRALDIKAGDWFEVANRDFIHITKCIRPSEKLGAYEAEAWRFHRQTEGSKPSYEKEEVARLYTVAMIEKVSMIRSSHGEFAECMIDYLLVEPEEAEVRWDSLR